MKNATFALILVLFISACSHKNESNAASGIPQFLITANDVSNVSVKPVTIVETGRKLAELDIMFSGSRFHKFAQEYLNQRVRLLVGTNLLVETQMNQAMADGKLELSCSTVEKAQATADLLTKK